MKGGFPSSTLGPCRQRTHIWASVLIVWTSGKSMKGGVNITLIVVKDRDDLSDARREYYASLAEFFLNQIGRGPDTILEAGSGKGQMTFPLIANLSRRARLITVDSSEGPYERVLGTVPFRFERARARFQHPVYQVRCEKDEQRRRREC